MKLSPFMKKVEVEGGYRGFYKSEGFKFTVTVEDSGIGVVADSRQGIALDSGELYKLFKPMKSMWDGKSYMEKLGEVCLMRLKDEGFVEVASVLINNKFSN
jgi:hypothetical protein